jgi:hypothetical protein
VSLHQERAMKKFTHTLILSLIVLLLLCVLIRSDQPPPLSIWERIALPYTFSITGWEFSNFFNKWENRLKQLYFPDRLSDEDKVTLVKQYLSLAQEASSLQDIVNLKKAEGANTEEIIKLETQLAELVRKRNSLEDRVEEIIEAQISKILADENIARTIRVFGQVELLFPPVDFEFQDQPYVLIVSPREKIEISETILLRSELSLEQILDIEDRVSSQGMSGFVERTGGVATYPSIVPRSVSLEYLLSTVAHEWLHQYFYFHPLGRNYWANYEMISINETAAGIAGDEIGSLVYNRYYRQEDNDDRGGREDATVARESEPAFDFNKEMREIRLVVDKYLAEGRIDEAENYMEVKRKYLAENGYYIRKLNQAYFAFHGSYADSPTSVNPIGDYLKELRQRSPSLGDFIRTVSGISSYDELLKMIGE